MEKLNYKDLRFYNLMRELVVLIYNVTGEYPKEEQGFNGLVSQLRRAIVSSVSNIAEGSSRKEKEFLHFLSLSLGSLREVETQVGISKDLSYMTYLEYEEISEKLDECIAKLCNYIKKINRY